MKSLQSALLVGAVGALLSQDSVQPPVTEPPKQKFVMPFSKNFMWQKPLKASKKDAKGQPLPKRSFAGMYPNHPAFLSRGYLSHKRWKRNRRASAD